MYVWEPSNFAQSFLARTKPQKQNETLAPANGYLNIIDLKRLKNSSTGMDLPRKEQVEFCGSCCQAKMSSSPFQIKGHKAEHMYQYIYADIMGSFSYTDS